MLVPELHSDGISSLSARRAWIEISANALPITSPTVALRKESVDRNIIFNTCRAGPIESLSAGGVGGERKMERKDGKGSA